ncbi:MAG TPA: L-threonylcarbamoyladenylate synthase [bacterium]|nr:L-threonylcarbamoyladenylate synthase [bacterium]
MPTILKHFEEFRDTLERGWVVAYPTETTYGLGVNPFNKDAVSLLDKVKNRSKGKPYLMLVKDMEMLETYAEMSTRVRELMSVLWPGPVSVVLKAKPKLPEWMIEKNGNACFRVSSSKFAEKVFEYIDRPIVSTSANPEGFPIAKDISEVVSYFQSQEQLSVFPDIYEDVKGRLPSTIVDLTLDKPKVLRKGAFNIVF